MYPSQQVFFVLGLSRSGKAATEFLLELHAKVYIYDDLSNERIEQVSVELQNKGAKRIEKTDLEKMATYCDVLVLSPGIPIDHPVAIAFKRNGKAVVGESELAARFMKCPTVAITGTNGKTTTVSMLADALNKGGLTAKACGNIGTPMLDFRHLTSEIAVAEISSFQLETLNSLKPHVAVILNITEDHLNRHYSMENYVFLKGKLLKNLTASEYAVLNYDDGIVRNFSNKTKAKVVFFSIRERVNGGYYENGALYFGKEKIMDVEDLSIGGLHNVQNALAVICVAKIFGVSTQAIVSALTEFKGIRHRIEQVAEVNGITYIDDSKGTNVDATIKAIACMKAETILLLGGKDKGYDYTKLFQNLSKSKVVHTVIYGENKYSLLKCARSCGYERVTMCDGMEFAVKVATLKAKSGQTVLLSPASASFDEFASYEERGDKFVEIVNSFIKETDIEEDKGEIEFEEIESDESSEQIGTDASDERGRFFLEDYE